ncbi:MAG: FAD-binding oxidoreductase [Burkholderiaceae bacterium]|nr:FAD-binding oxidoreductase [Burkholderiaceae bacterium]
MSLFRADQSLASHSYYAATVPQGPCFPSLSGELECDVAVVGGGLAGLSAAIELADLGFDVALLDARRIGYGASGRNGGQALAGLACEQSVIESQLGAADSRAVWDMTLEAIALIHARCERFGIDCDWQGGYLSLATSERKGRELAQWHEHMQRRYGYQATPIGPGEVGDWIASPRFHSGLHDPLSGHLHPLKYCIGLARAAEKLGVRIFENSAVTSLSHGTTATLHTADGRLRARHVLLAGNVYLNGVAPLLARRIMPVGTYVVASERLDPALARSLIPSRAAVCDTNFVLDYFRPTPDDRLLYGGRVSYSTVTPPNLEASMRARMARTFPQLKGTQVEYAWGGFVDISMNRAPDFGRLSDIGGGREAANVYYLQGFSGHGLALTGLAGKLVAEAIGGDATRLDTFARIRHRPFPGGPMLRTPALVLGMAYYRLRDML